MPKGSQQTGSSTSSAETRAGAAQFPYFEGGLKEAGRIYGDSGAYPNYAPPDPRQISGYNNIANTGYNIAAGLQPASYDAYGNILSGGGTSPAQPGYQQFATGTAGPQHNADIWGLQAAQGQAPNAAAMVSYANQAAGGNLGQDQLAAVAQGKYTDASSNPYLRDMVNAALRPVSENYATSTAPTIDARFSGGGRYGSGAADVAAGSARDAFARNLGEISTGMYGKEYQFERGQQDTAAQQYDAARRAGLGLGITGIQSAGNLTDQGLRTALSAADLTQRGQFAGRAGLDTGFGRGLTTQEDALRQYPQFAQSQFIMPRAEIEAGKGLQDLQQQAYNAPFERLKQYMATIGAPSGGASATQPIFGNPLTSAVSGASGILGLGKELGLGSAASSLFGGGAGDAATLASLGGEFGGGGTGAFVTAAAPELAAAGTGGKAAAEAAPLILASDRRLKEDATIIGKVGALPLYSFRYKGDPTPRIGFMADEVEQIDPGAVHSMAGGFKAVDYGRAMRAALK
jgi:hypothetical protein